MTYIVCKENVTRREINERIKYIYDVFHIYILVDTKNSNENVVFLKSVPCTGLDLFFIVGHTGATNRYLKEHYKKIRERNILIISCYIKFFLSANFLKNKKVYVPINDGKIKTYSGECYGFDFEITFEELRLYRNRKLGLEKLLSKIFIELV